jgi:hypothetical protein
MTEPEPWETPAKAAINFHGKIAQLVLGHTNNCSPPPQLPRASVVRPGMGGNCYGNHPH